MKEQLKSFLKELYTWNVSLFVQFLKFGNLWHFNKNSIFLPSNIWLRCIMLLLFFCFFCFLTIQGRRKVWKSGGGGIICPHGWDRVNWYTKKMEGLCPQAPPPPPPPPRSNSPALWYSWNVILNSFVEEDLYIMRILNWYDLLKNRDSATADLEFGSRPESSPVMPWN